MFISSDLKLSNLSQAIKAKAFISLAYDDLILFISTSSLLFLFKSCTVAPLQLLHIFSAEEINILLALVS